MNVRLGHEGLDEENNVFVFEFFEGLDFGFEVGEHFIVADAFFGYDFDGEELARSCLFCLADSVYCYIPKAPRPISSIKR